jgi:hypothetical protein
MSATLAFAAVARERIPVPIEQEAGWVPVAVWPFWEREKSVVPGGIEKGEELFFLFLLFSALFM